MQELSGSFDHVLGIKPTGWTHEKGKLHKKIFIASYYRQLAACADIRMKNYKIKTSFVSLEGPKARANKTGIIL